MSNEHVHLTMVHISDLHFFHKLEGRTVQSSAQLPAFISVSTVFDGWLGHHYKALSALDSFWHRESTSDTLLIVTGDLTANGHADQFNIADQFLAQRSVGRSLGLGRRDWSRLSVPGNHDQWPGTNLMCGSPTPGLTSTFPDSFPRISAPLQLGNGSTLRFISVDSDADVRRLGMGRALARGSFVSQLSALEKALPRKEPDETRVLVLHHSILATTVTLAIDGKTRRVLEHFVVDHDISVVLSGHMHVPRLSRRTMSNGHEQKEILDARCGTTTQRDEFPYSVRAKIPANRLLPPNTLMVHKVLERKGKAYWSSQIYWRSRQGRFVKDVPRVSSFLPGDLSAEIALT
ncbi:MAG: metallophosphoesterase [Rhodospirillales bacterium]|nr:metallophosphoesterase [Rhodospirillales bacterium]